MAFKRSRGGNILRRRTNRRTSRRARRTTRRRLPARNIQKMINNSGETKYLSKWQQFTSDSFGLSLGTVCPSGSYTSVSVFPAVGTGLNQRIGNCIQNAKLFINMKIIAYFGVEFQPCFEIRVIMFSLPGLGVITQTNDIPAFFKASDTGCNNIMFQDINRENIRVYMDKIIPMKQMTSGYSASQDIALEHNLKQFNINRNLGKVIFITGGTAPKYSSQQLYIAVFANAVNSTQRLCLTQIRSKLYYKDN